MSKLNIFTISVCLLISSCAHNIPPEADFSNSTLTLIETSKLDEARASKTVNFSQYKKILIEPINIAYSDKLRTGHHAKEDFEMTERQEKKFNEIVNKSLSDRLAKDWSWQTALSPGENTLKMQIKIIDLHLNAPLTDNPPSSRSFTRESSTMLAVITLVDGASNETLFQAREKITTGDKSEGPMSLQPHNSVRYWHDLGISFRRLAGQLSQSIPR